MKALKSRKLPLQHPTTTLELLLYSKPVSSMLNTEQVTNSRLNLKSVSIIFLVVVSFVLVDVTVGSLADIYSDFSLTGTGKALFLSITGVLFVGTYVILKITTDKIRRGRSNGTYESKVQKVVWAVYYLMVAIMALVILQMLFFSEYYTNLLSIAPSISYGVATCLMGLLAYRFFNWFKRNKSLVVLLYGLASVSALIYVSVIAVIFM